MGLWFLLSIRSPIVRREKENGQIQKAEPVRISCKHVWYFGWMERGKR